MQRNEQYCLIPVEQGSGAVKHQGLGALHVHLDHVRNGDDIFGDQTVQRHRRNPVLTRVCDMPRGMTARCLKTGHSILIRYSRLNQVDIAQPVKPDVLQQIFGIPRTGFERPYLAFRTCKPRKSQCIETGVGAYVKDRHARFDELFQGLLLVGLVCSQPATVRTGPDNPPHPLIQAGTHPDDTGFGKQPQRQSQEPPQKRSGRYAGPVNRHTASQPGP